jgi:hypothetical protein
MFTILQILAGIVGIEVKIDKIKSAVDQTPTHSPWTASSLAEKLAAISVILHQLSKDVQHLKRELQGETSGTEKRTQAVQEISKSQESTYISNGKFTTLATHKTPSTEPAHTTSRTALRITRQSLPTQTVLQVSKTEFSL